MSNEIFCLRHMEATILRVLRYLPESEAESAERAESRFRYAYPKEWKRR
jgi:hypothetical protein